MPVRGHKHSDGLASKVDITIDLKLAGTQVLGGLRNFFGEDRPAPSQHRLPEGKRSGQRKRYTFHSPGLGMICFQQGQRWYCFEVTLGDGGTPERRG